VRFASDPGSLTVLDARRRAGARYVPQGGDVFVLADDPSVELRFQVRGDQVDGYRRYRNGWFAGMAHRAPESPPLEAAP
jgi:hypothetical protein